jgi:hypothetical protein
LIRKPGQRLGMKGASEVKNHPWLKYYPWKELYEKSLESPFIPKLGDNFDKKFCESPDKLGETTKSRYEKYIHEENFKNVFKNFTIININNHTHNPNKEELKDKDKDRDIDRKKIYNSTLKPNHAKSTSLINPQSQNIYLIENNNNNNINNNNNNFNISSIMNSTGIMNNTNIKSINMNNININANHKKTKSVNNINSNIIQAQINEKDKDRDKDKDNRENKDRDRNKRNLEYTPERVIHNSSLYEPRSAAPSVLPQGKLPSINNIDRIKIRKLINSNNSSLLFKYYKSNSINKNGKYNINNHNSNIDSNSLLMKSQIFNKKKL